MNDIYLDTVEICKPWVEKYRPKVTTDIVQQGNLKKIIDIAHINSDLPHMLFHGPPGCGKTTTAFSICRQYFYNPNKSKKDNKQIFDERVLELNASDERGICVVKGKIKTFAEKTISIQKDIPNFKLIILDECDAMTPDSQFALRRTMEDYSFDTRMILICNNISQIIAPILSRTLIIKYKSIEIDYMSNVILKIAKAENISVTKAFISRLHAITNGDMRKAINLLEQISLLFENHTINNLNECAGMINIQYFNHIVDVITNPETSIQDIYHLTNTFTNEAYSLPSLVFEFFTYIVDLQINSETKMKLVDIMVKVDSMIHNKASEFVVLIYLFTSLHNYLINE